LDPGAKAAGMVNVVAGESFAFANLMKTDEADLIIGVELFFLDILDSFEEISGFLVYFLIM
jgi:hypothetical protein